MTYRYNCTYCGFEGVGIKRVKGIECPRCQRELICSHTGLREQMRFGSIYVNGVPERGEFTRPDPLSPWLPDWQEGATAWVLGESEVGV